MERGDTRVTEMQTASTPLTRAAAKSSFRFRVDESVSEGLARISGEMIQRAVARIERAGVHRAEDLHQVRITLKRLRALLRLARPVISKAFYAREKNRLKAMAERLAFFRDSMVSRQALVTLAGSFTGERSQTAFNRVLARFVEQGADRSRFQARREQALRHTAADLLDAKQSFENMLIPAEDWKALGTGLQKVYGRARNQMLSVLSAQTSEAFHDWRKQVKYLYYQLQMLGSISPKRLESMVRKLGTLEDRLGFDHDLAVLERLLCDGRERYGGKWAVKRVVGCLVRKSKKLRKETAALGADIFREKPRKFVEKLGKHWSVWRDSATLV